MNNIRYGMTLAEYHIYFKWAWKAAKNAHQAQEYNGKPYTNHLEDVFSVLLKFGFYADKDDESRCILIAAILHDTIEDTALSYNDIINNTCYEVAEIVYAMSDGKGRNRKEKKVQPYIDMRKYPLSIPVKLADRIANIETGGKINMYRKEHEEFEAALHIYRHCDDMWDYLRELVK